MADFWSNLTNGVAHAGSWAGLPDFGVTEKVGNLLGVAPTAQGGSNLNPYSINVSNPFSSGSSSNPAVKGTSTGTSGGAYPIAGGYTPPVVQSNPVNNGGSSLLDQWKALGNTGDLPVGWNGPGGGTSQEDLNNQINALYDPQYNYLNQAESNLKTDFGNLNTDITNNYATNSQMLADQKKSASGLYDQASVTGFNQKEDALAAARRLYDQLRRGYQQRFGGSTSAGQAASEISSAEQQRQQGGVQRDYGTLMSQIDQKRADLERGYSTSLMSLKQQTDAARNQAMSDYQSKLLSITQSRSQLETGKAQAKLDALQQLRNQVFAINQQNLQYQQNLSLMKEQAAMTLQSYQQQLLANNNNLSSQYNTAMSNMTTNPQSGLQVQGTQQSTNNPYVGQMTNSQPDYKKYPNNGFTF